MKPEELSWTAALNRIAELEAENKHYREWLGASSVDARVAALEEKLTWAMGLNACIEHERAERLSFELAALKARRCENCKSWEADRVGPEYGTCHQGVLDGLVDTTTNSFGCNQWTARDEEGRE